MIEEHIRIDERRFITVPKDLQRIAVQGDHNVETVTFDCPRYADGKDMSKMRIFINYMCADRSIGMYLAKNVQIDADDSNIMHFDWTITRNASKVKGALSFLVCVKKTDEFGYSLNHWNSELNQEMYVSEGLECEEPVLEAHADIISYLLARQDFIEGKSYEYVAQRVDEYFEENPLGIDETLTGVGKPAEGKAVGDQVARLDGRVDETNNQINDTNTRIDNLTDTVSDLDSDVDVRIETHNTGDDTHLDIRQDVATAQTSADEAMLEGMSHRPKHFTNILIRAAGWVAHGNYFKQEIAVEGILATDYPEGFDVLTGDDMLANVTYRENMVYIQRIQTLNNKIALYATDVTSVDIPIHIKVVR